MLNVRLSSGIPDSKQRKLLTQNYENLCLPFQYDAKKFLWNILYDKIIQRIQNISINQQNFKDLSMCA